jgi:DnaJ family protein A protein 2
MPSQRHHEPGDLYVRFTVLFPESIDPAVIPQLEAALPARPSLPKLAKSTLTEEVDLDEMDARQRKKAERVDAMDEDEGEPRVQCANQ